MTLAVRWYVQLIDLSKIQNATRITTGRLKRHRSEMPAALGQSKMYRSKIESGNPVVVVPVANAKSSA
ncbi:MAG: hypothetical protein CMJ77_14770 [Planctomycetaceae bacterium]|nr:hypothetical protein [Planctomycetaceae bacterium]